MERIKLEPGQFILTGVGNVIGSRGVKGEPNVWANKVDDLDACAPGEIHTFRGDRVITRAEAEAILIARAL